MATDRFRQRPERDRQAWLEDPLTKDYLADLLAQLRDAERAVFAAIEGEKQDAQIQFYGGVRRGLLKAINHAR